MAQSLTRTKFNKVQRCVRDRVESPKCGGIERRRTWSESPARRERPNLCTKKYPSHYYPNLNHPYSNQTLTLPLIP
ncbi:MAG: hypothetical protein K0R51_2779 [Cytophagaceae bacterium]|jgi:hypothetical protein|nr:hypothetical protein [Cytophagaceae bacterium]